VLADVKAWQSRPLASVYPILYFDALIVQSREAGPVKNKAVYLALGVNLQGEKEVLGLWMADPEGAKFWQVVFTAYKSDWASFIRYALACSMSPGRSASGWRKP
jgi:putative transposase